MPLLCCVVDATGQEEQMLRGRCDFYKGRESQSRLICYDGPTRLRAFRICADERLQLFMKLDSTVTCLT